MCDDDVIYVFGLETLRFKRLEHGGDATARIVVDERSMLAIRHEIRRSIVFPLHIVAVDSSDGLQVVCRARISARKQQALRNCGRS